MRSTAFGCCCLHTPSAAAAATAGAAAAAAAGTAAAADVTPSAAAANVTLSAAAAESEFALWVESIAAGGSYDQMCEALRLMGHELNHLKPRTLGLVARFFE